jgi:Tfp pilus assembly protein PilF
MLPPHLRVPDPQTYYDHGVMLTQRGHHLDAALVYRQALQFTPESADIYNNCGWSLAKLGFYQASIAMFEQALRLRPGFALAEHNLTWVKTQQMHAP